MGGNYHQKELLASLLEKASVQGYLTSDDLQELAREYTDVERLSVLMISLRQHGVEVLDMEKPEADQEPEVELWGMDLDGGDNDSVGMYLKEMSRVPLLGMAEEQELAERIVVGRKARVEINKNSSKGECN